MPITNIIYRRMNYQGRAHHVTTLQHYAIQSASKVTKLDNINKKLTNKNEQTEWTNYKSCNKQVLHKKTATYLSNSIYNWLYCEQPLVPVLSTQPSGTLSLPHFFIPNPKFFPKTPQNSFLLICLQQPVSTYPVRLIYFVRYWVITGTSCTQVYI